MKVTQILFTGKEHKNCIFLHVMFLKGFPNFCCSFSSNFLFSIFLCSLSVLPKGSENFISTSEDRTIKVWIGNISACLFYMQVITTHVYFITFQVYIYINYICLICIYPIIILNVVELAANNAFNNDILSFKISEGNCTQTITLPAQSVWCSVCLENGDFAVGSRCMTVHNLYQRQIFKNIVQ